MLQKVFISWTKCSQNVDSFSWNINWSINWRKVKNTLETETLGRRRFFESLKTYWNFFKKSPGKVKLALSWQTSLSFVILEWKMRSFFQSWEEGYGIFKAAISCHRKCGAQLCFWNLWTKIKFLHLVQLVSKSPYCQNTQQ